MRKLKGDGQPAVYVEGYQGRYFEFEDFERKFEKCLSETAVKTKFQQHCERGYEIVQSVMSVMDKTFQAASQLRKSKQDERDAFSEKLEFTRQQMAVLTDEVKHRIEQLVEQVHNGLSVFFSSCIYMKRKNEDQCSSLLHLLPHILYGEYFRSNAKSRRRYPKRSVDSTFSLRSTNDPSIRIRPC